MTRLASIFALAIAVAFAAGTAVASDSDGDGVDDEFDAFPCDPRAAASVFSPGQGEHGSLLFEDQWPSNGDLDFNDASLAYNSVIVLDANGDVVTIRLTLNLLSAGATTSNGVAIRLPVPASSIASATRSFTPGVDEPLAPWPGESQAVIQLIDDTRALFGNPAGAVNTDPAIASVPGVPVVLQVELATPLSIDPALAPFDLFIHRVGDRGHQIHLPQYAGTDSMNNALFGTGDDASTAGRHFVNGSGLPFALHLPELVLSWPKENVAFDVVYPDIIGFATSGGTANQNWYETNVVQSLLWTQGLGGSPPPQPVFVGPDHVPASPLPCSSPPPVPALPGGARAVLLTILAGSGFLRALKLVRSSRA